MEIQLIEAGDVGIYVAVWFAGFVKVAGGVVALWCSCCTEACRSAC